MVESTRRGCRDPAARAGRPSRGRSMSAPGGTDAGPSPSSTTPPNLLGMGAQECRAAAWRCASRALSKGAKLQVTQRPLARPGSLSSVHQTPKRSAFLSQSANYRERAARWADPPPKMSGLPRLRASGPWPKPPDPWHLPPPCLYAKSKLPSTDPHTTIHERGCAATRAAPGDGSPRERI